MSTQWFENSKLWKDISPFIFSEASFIVAQHEVFDLIKTLNNLKSLRIDEQSQVLDLGCGPGRHTLPLLDLGFKVDALDLQQSYLDTLKEKSQSLSGTLNTIQQDMRDPLNENYYDLALCLFTSFGYFENWSDNAALLKNLHSSLRKGAFLVLEITSKTNFPVDESGLGQRKRQVSDKESLIEVWKVFEKDDHSRVSNDWTFIGTGKAQRFKFEHWLFGRMEIENLLRDTGFDKVHFYSSFMGSMYNSESKSMVVVAQK